MTALLVRVLCRCAQDPVLMDSILCLHLQNTMSSTDLDTMLANIGRKDGHALKQLYACFDGSKASLSSVPDIKLFSNRTTGKLFC